jgi:hypothetical protein
VARIRELGGALVDALEPVDQAFIGTFAIEIALSAFVTSDHAILHRVLREEVRPAHRSNFVGNAVEVALASLPRTAIVSAVRVVGRHRFFL